MTALVLRAFAHEHNRPEVARQEYDAAKDHYRRVLLHCDPLNPDHTRRFHDALDRLDAARERWLGFLTR